MSMWNPRELELAEREEHAARLRLAEAREQNLRSEGEAPTEDHELVKKLEAEWHHALERLHLARKATED